MPQEKHPLKDGQRHKVLKSSSAKVWLQLRVLKLQVVIEGLL